MHYSMRRGEQTLVSEHLHEQGVLLPAIDDVRGSHALCQASRAALHPAAASPCERRRGNVMKQKESAMRRARGFASLGQDTGFLLPIPTLAWSSRDSNGWT